MTNMFDALLAALPDSAFFQQTDFGAKFKDQLLVSDVPFGCYLRGAARWDIGKHPTYPIYSASKTNTEDNLKFVPYKNGSVVLSSEETGELLVYFLKADAGKSPSLKPRAHSVPSSVPDAKSYATRDLWRVISSEEMCGGRGKYMVFMHAGDFQSQPFAMEVFQSGNPPKESPFAATLKTKAISGKVASGIFQVEVDPSSHFPIPAEAGVKWTLGKNHGGEHGSHHYPIQGSFRFKGTWPKDFERLPIHFLVAAENVAELDVNSFWISKSDCKVVEGEYSGTFKFDLADLFIAPGDGKSKPPKEVWISVVHRGWRGAIEKVELK